MLLWASMFNSLYGHIFSFSWVYFLDHMATRCLIFSETTRLFLKTAAPFHMFPSNVGGPNVFTSLLILLITWLFDYNHPTEHEVVSHCSFNLHFFLMTNNVKGCVCVHMYVCVFIGHLYIFGELPTHVLQAGILYIFFGTIYLLGSLAKFMDSLLE